MRATTPAYLNGCGTGEVDFGFVNPDAVTGLETQFIKEGELRAVVPADHYLSARSYVTWGELAKEPFLLLEEGNLSEPLEAFRQLALEPDITRKIGLDMKEKHSLPIACKHFITFLMNNIASLP
ncbi:LysR substrate-binding domain-containing protein [Trichococcus collinsii]|uniref:LysR substrate-binding domain-containing protein n=1 Tax=Trichococcus collinsii TaxID=157076 RepID=UPI000B357277